MQCIALVVPDRAFGCVHYGTMITLTLKVLWFKNEYLSDKYMFLNIL